MMISEDIDYDSLLKNSICGGNYEIIHIVENQIKDLNNICILYINQIKIYYT